MLSIAIGLFILGAAFGLVALTHVMRTRHAPRWAGITHGLFVATALLLVIISAVNRPDSTLIVSIVFFVTAALGGFAMAYLDFSGKPVPKALALIHPVIAVTGLIILIIYVSSYAL